MFTAADNTLLTRTGPETAMSRYFRRFWLPVALSRELPECDGAPMPGEPDVRCRRAGKPRALAMTSAKRSSSAPELPTVAETANLPGYEATIRFGLAGPAGTLRERFAPQRVKLAATTPEEFAEIINAEIPKWGKVLRDANIAPE